MKLSVLGECAESNSPSQEKTKNGINLRLLLTIFKPNKKIQILNLLPEEHVMVVKKSSHATVPLTEIYLDGQYL